MSAVEAPVRARPISTRFFRSELSMVFRRRRNQALLAVLAGIPIVIAIAIKVTAPVDDGKGGPPFLFSITGNGIFVALTSLTVVLPLFLPLAVAVVSGESVAGEASLGTLRYLLVVPVSRTRLLTVKYGAALVYCLAAALLVGVVGTVMGAILFPVGPVTLLSGLQVSYGSGLARLLLVALYIAAMMAGLAAIGLFVSTLTESPIAAMATTAVLAVLSQVLNQVPQLDWLAPWLFSHYWLNYGDLLRTPVATTGVINGLLATGAYILVFGSLAWSRMTTKDVSS
ncbi:MAG TPA: ABC transporter permease [Mycobacteriales bacterium]|nr:ABC transporter permease [Mycobacteriales bacterium]